MTKKTNKQNIIISIIRFFVNLNNQYHIAKFIFTFLFIYLLYKNYIDLYILFRSVVILLLLALYKGLLIHLGNDRNIIHPSLKIRARVKMFKNINDYIFKRHTFLIRPLYYVLYYFPTNWPFLFIMGMAKKGASVRLIVNSQKDLLAIFYLGQDGSNMKAPLNYDSMKWFKKYIFDVFFRVLYLPVYLKIMLISIEWKRFFEYRLFGIVYAVVLITYDLSVVVGFKNTHLMCPAAKVAMVFLIVYFFLLYFYIYVIKKVVPVFDAMEDFIDKPEKNLLTPQFLYNLACKKSVLQLETLVKSPTIRTYYSVQDYLIFMSLANYLEIFISGKYNIYLIKHTNRHNKKIPSNLSKFGKLCDYKFESDDAYLVGFLNEFVGKKHYVDAINRISNTHKLNGVDYIGILEKNYKAPLYSYFMSAQNGNWQNFDFLLTCYELYKTLYGADLVKAVFEAEICQIEDYLFIHSIMDYMFVNYFKVDDIMDKIMSTTLEDFSSLKIKKSMYYQLLELCNFYIYNPYDKAKMLNYFDYFDKSAVLCMRIIYNDNARYGKNWANLDDMIKGWTVHPRQESLDDSIMQMRIQVYSKHYPAIDSRIDGLKLKIDAFLQQHVVSKHLSTKEFVALIKNLQQSYADKHTKTIICLQSDDFIEKNAVLPQGSLFAKLNRDMLF